MIAAGHADHHLAIGYAWGHGKGEPLLRKCHARFPEHFAGEGIQRFQPAIDDRSEDLAVINRQTAVDDATAHPGPDRFLIHFRVPSPKLLTGARIDRENHAPGSDAVNRVVPDQRRGFLIAAAGPSA